MKTEYEKEYNFPVGEKATQQPRPDYEKPTDTEKEFYKASDFEMPNNEFFGSNLAASKKKEDKHSSLKKSMLIPLLSVTAAASLIMASFNYDPLGVPAYGETGSELSSSIEDESSAGDESSVGNETSSEDETNIGEKADDAFPALSNLEPDFAGQYAWSGNGSEEYIRFTGAVGSEASQIKYIHMGSVWASFGYYDADGNLIPNTVTEVPGARYDRASNTLTLENFTGEYLDVNLMGNSFKINLVGDNYLDYVVIWGAGYGGSVTFTGSGSLTVNSGGGAPEGIGIKLNAEQSPSCIMVDKGVTLDVYGSSAAVLVAGTTMEKAIYYLKPVKLTGGMRASGDYGSYSFPVTDENGNYIGSEEKTVTELSEIYGFKLYDYSVADENGKPATYVRFAPG